MGLKVLWFLSLENIIYSTELHYLLAISFLPFMPFYTSLVINQHTLKTFMSSTKSHMKEYSFLLKLFLFKHLFAFESYYLSNSIMRLFGLSEFKMRRGISLLFRDMSRSRVKISKGTLLGFQNQHLHMYTIFFISLPTLLSSCF